MSLLKYLIKQNALQDLNFLAEIINLVTKP